MKKFTLMILFALVGVMSAMAQDADPHYYSLSNGTFSDEYGTTGYYRSWTSTDSLLTIQFTGYAYHYTTKGYEAYYSTYPGDMIIKAADGYKIDSLWICGGAYSDTIDVYFYDYLIKSFDPNDEYWRFLEGYDLNIQELDFNLVARHDSLEAAWNIYDDGTYSYTLIAISQANDSTITGIKTIKPETQKGSKTKLDDDAWYNLSGQRVALPGKGIYIRNGRKVIRR